MENLILTVEDNPNDALLLSTAFRKANVSALFEFLTDRQQAIDYFANSPPKPMPTLLLLDLRFPKNSGLEVLAWVRANPHPKRLPTVMLTSSSEPQGVHEAYDLGANSYLVKPGSMDQLIGLAETIELYWLKANASPVMPG